MANQVKEYTYKKFEINEISNAFKKTIEELNIEKEQFSIRHIFNKDDINDEEYITLRELGRLTELYKGDQLILSFDSSNFIGLTNWYPNDKSLMINVHAENREKLKKIFSIIESELNLQELAKKVEKDNGIGDNSENVKQINEIGSIEDVETSHRRKFSPIRLYKEDLIEMIRLVKDHYKYVEIHLANKKMSDESAIDTVKANIKKDFTDNFSIKGSDNEWMSLSKIYLDLSRYGADITVNDKKDTYSIGVLYQLAEIISKRENKLDKLLNNLRIFALVIFALFLLYVPLIIFKNELMSYNFWIYIFLISIPIILIIYVYYRTFKSHTVIYLFDSNDKTWINWIKENYGLIGLIVSICILIVAIISLILNRWY